MDGREVALATLHREPVSRPCITSCWVTKPEYYTYVTGRDYWGDREGVFCEFVRRVGANLVPQWYYPDEGHQRLADGHPIWEPGSLDGAGFASPEDVVHSIDALPDDETVEQDFDIEGAADAYAAAIGQRMEKLGPDVLVIDTFGQADFMGGYNRWGYENYLAAAGLYPEALRRYYHHSALCGRLQNQAICLAVEKHGIAPFVYSGQDICGSGGPLMSPAMLREIYFPELKWCMEPLVHGGVGVIWHCDGDIRPILPDLLDLGIIGLQGFEEEHGVQWEHITSLRDQRSKPIAVWGCVSVTTTLPHGSPADVRAAVERSFVVAGSGRGHVLSSTSSVMPETPTENIDALFAHARRFGREFLGG